MTALGRARYSPQMSDRTEAQPADPDRIRRISGISEIADPYDVLICDVWGVLHDGTVAYRGAGEALRAWRAAGKRVILLSNAPRPGASVAEQLLRYGYQAGPEGHYDQILTSGDATRAAIAGGSYGQKLLHLGPERDAPLIEGLPVSLGSLDDCEFVLCSGLYDDERETVTDYEDRLQAMARRGLTMLCANPDITVMRGSKTIYCAGALAARYRELGGEVVYFGKPHPPVYAQCRALARTLMSAPGDKQTPTPRLLVIGDGLHTDITGAQRAAIDSVLVLGGIHADALGFADGVDMAAVDPVALRQVCARAGAIPDAIIGRFVW
ncbi:MAG TPA: TIGR01459 family HAD-type hydrolase [Alphaproteobacteria bacterium]|nr:TIGR01459 family HAD-type hydrolase [Alphaproteobacteria bacterium]